jgi:hypothetical protein
VPLAQVPGRAHRVTARRSGLHHRGIPARRGRGGFDRPAWSGVLGSDRLDEGEDMLGAVGCPQGEQMVVFVGERSAAADRHQAGVADRREDHDRAAAWRVIEGAH